MKVSGRGQRIIWLVRVLAAVGLLLVVMTMMLVGRTLAKVHNERTLAIAEQEQLNRALVQLRQLAIESRIEIQTPLDETQAKPAQPMAARQLRDFVESQLKLYPAGAMRQSLAQLDVQTTDAVNISSRTEAWRDAYDIVWDDIRKETTLGKARALVTQMRSSVASLEGARRLAQATEFLKWRKTTGEESDQQAKAMVFEFARQQSNDTVDLNNQLAELARLVELLGGAEQIDTLADLKDNQLIPALARIRRSVSALSADPSGANVLSDRAVDDLEVVLFGDSGVDVVSPTIEPDEGGLFTLRRDALTLRQQREKLKNELAGIFQEIESAIANFAQSTQIRNTVLTQQMEANLADAWQSMAIFGGCGCIVFLWLAWLISRGIKGQVNTIEQARAEAESGRQITQKLMIEQQAAASKLAAAHSELKTSEQRFRTLSAAAPIGVFETDASSGVTYANPQWEKITDLPLAQSMGKGWQQALAPEDAAAISAAWEDSARTGQDFVREFQMHGRAGEARWVSMRTTTIRSEAGDLLGRVGTVEDITERKRAEAELARAHQKLMEASREAGKAEIATSVLHNVGNVLNSVNVSVSVVTSNIKKSAVTDLARAIDLMKEHKNDLGEFLTQHAQGSQVPGFLEAVSEAMTGEQEALLTEMQSLAKNVDHIKQIVSVQQSNARNSTVAEKIQIVDLVEDALRVNMISLENNHIEIVREFSAAPELVTDKHMLLQILINLISNAKHALAGSGRNDRRLTLRASVKTEPDSDYLVFSVCDNGMGIDAANLTRIFNHGFTTKKNGHGFGLHSSANTAKQLGGSLRASSDGPGTGATFTVTLPINKEAQAVAA